MLTSIQNKMEAQFKRAGVPAEVTFIRESMLSVLVDGKAAFAKAKAIMASVQGLTFDSEDLDDECGNVAYYCF